jgi:hypothetical protein
MPPREATGAPGISGEPGADLAAGAAPGTESGWVVIHGGPDPSSQAEASPSGAGAPAVVLQLGEVPADSLSQADPEAGQAEDGGTPEAAAPIAWEEICRPWQPGAAARQICPAAADAEGP